jgi:hypothetical protein
MVGVEMVSNKESRKELGGDTMNNIFEDLKDAGLLVGKGGLYGNVRNSFLSLISICQLKLIILPGLYLREV